MKRILQVLYISLLLCASCWAQILTQNYRGTRSVNTPVHNTSGSPLLVVAYRTGWDQINAWSDASATPTTQRWDSQGIGINTRGSSAIFPVQPNHYYTIGAAGTGGTINVLEIAVGTGAIADSGNIAASRSLGNNYHNNSGGAMLVTVTMLGAVSPAALTVYSDDTPTPSATNQVWNSNTPGSAADSCGFIVPSGHYYRVESAGSTVSYWYEYLLPFSVLKTDVTASRVLGTPYQNTGAPDGMFVSVVRGTAFSSDGRRWFYSDTSNPPTTAEFFQQTSSSGVSESAGFALSNWYYATDAGVDPITKWWEYAVNGVPNRRGHLVHQIIGN